MLILARKPGQAIVLPDLGITIRVLAYASCGQVRIGIEADKEVRILREEVADAQVYYRGCAGGGGDCGTRSAG